MTLAELARKAIREESISEIDGIKYTHIITADAGYNTGDALELQYGDNISLCDGEENKTSDSGWIYIPVDKVLLVNKPALRLIKKSVTFLDYSPQHFTIKSFKKLRA
jgi:hypothetical protein